MSISDDGVGLTQEERGKNGSFGLVGIEERITILGGTCAINGEFGRGTTVWVTVPAHQAFAPHFDLEDMPGIPAEDDKQLDTPVH